MAKTTRAVDKYLSEKRAAGRLTKTTEVQHRRVLFGFAEHCPQDPGKIRRRDVLRWSNTVRSLAAGTRRFYWSTVKGFTDWLQQRGVLSKDPFADLPRPRVPQPVHRALDTAQVAALVEACETPREYVLILLALHSGLRRAELAALEVGDVSLAGRSVHVRAGKGDKSRTVPLSEEAAMVVGRYMAMEGLSAGPFLRSLVRPECGVSPQTVWRIFRQVAVRAGVKIRAWDGVSTHATRHTCATDLHRATGDVLVVQAFLGHDHISSTQLYVGRLKVDDCRAAVEGRSYLGVA